MRNCLKMMFMSAAIIVAACTSETLEPRFTLDTNMVNLTDGDQGVTDILLSSNVDLYVTVEEDAAMWLEAVVSRRCLTLSYTKNESGAERTGNVLVSAGELQQTVTLVQPAYIPPKVGYDVGDVVDGGKGVIYWVDSDDRSIAKAVSVGRLKGNVWSSDGTASGAGWFVNGSENALKLKDEKYQAALWCSALGEGWYLPACNELVEIFEIYNGTLASEATVAQPGSITDAEKASRAAFDLMLAAASADAMNAAGDTSNGDSYWTSTESETDPTMAYFVRFGKYLAEPISKTSTSRYTRCVRVYGDYVYGQEPELPDNPDTGGDNPGGEGGPDGALAVGDVWKENDKAVGVVFYVAEDGRSAKIVSLDRTETTVAWSTIGGEYLGAGSKTDGAANTSVLKASAQASSMPILSFCAAHGDGWYWPACNELHDIYLVKDKVEAALTANGGTAFGSDQYWSSTEFEDAPKYASHVRFDKDYVGTKADQVNKTGSTKRYGRCIRLITI